MAEKIILDCDPGIDDALAILFALALPELDLCAVTTVSGNRPADRTYENARRVVSLAGRADVPVYPGANGPLDQTEPRTNLVHGEDGLGGVDLPPSSAPQGVTVAAQKIIEVLAAAPEGEVTVVAVGPLTNLALALTLDPAVFRRAKRLAIMGGAVRVDGNVTPVAEFNFWADPLAADRVMQSGVPIELFGLDVTSQVVCTSEWLNALSLLPGAIGGCVSRMVAAYFREDPLLHDPCPLAWLVAPDLFTSTPMCIRVETFPGYCRGKSIGWSADRPDAPGHLNVNVHTHVDCEGLLAFMLAHIRRLSKGQQKT